MTASKAYGQRIERKIRFFWKKQIVGHWNDGEPVECQYVWT
jgi:hypothetical protein